MKELRLGRHSRPGAVRAGLLDARVVRWVLPAGLVAAELGALTLVGDFPSGPAAALVPAVRLALPVAFAAAASAWLMIGRGAFRSVSTPGLLPEWRPWPMLAAHAVAFAATAALTRRLLGESAPPLSLAGFVAWLTCVGATTILAIASAAPLRWTCRAVAQRWRVPLLSLAAGLLTWRAMALTESSWGILSHGTLRTVAWLLERVSSGAAVDVSGNVIGIGSFEVEIAASCSGVDGVGLVTLFQAVWIGLARSRIRVRRALLMLPLGAAAALLANALRISALMLLGASGRPELALGAFHSKIGWLAFILIALATTAAFDRFPWLQRADGSPTEREEIPASAGPYVAPLVGAVGAAFIGSMLARGSADQAYALRIVVPLLILFVVRKSLPTPLCSWSWTAALIGVGVSVLWVLFVRGDAGGLQVELSRMTPTARYTWLATRVLGSSLVIPLVEELAFRGFLLPWLASPDFERSEKSAWSWPAAAISSVAFGTLHGQWLAGALAGLAFAVARQLRGRVGDAVLAHAVCNLGVAAAVLLAGRWDLWT